MGAPQYEQAGADIGGTGTTNTIPRWTGPSTLGDSVIVQVGSNIGVGMTSGFPGRLGVLSQNLIGSADITFSFDAAGSFRHGFSNVFSSLTAANNTSTWLVWNAAGGQTQVMTANGVGNVGIGTASPSTRLHVLASAAPMATFASSLATQGYIQLNYNTSTTFGYIGSGASVIGGGAAGDLGFRSDTGVISFATGGNTERARIDSNGNIYGTSGTTGMTNGFFYIPAAAGAPTGVPTAAAGRVPMYYDTTNNQFYVYNGAWKKVTLA